MKPAGPRTRLLLPASRAELLRPIFRAYLFGHLSSTAPRVLTVLLSLGTRFENPIFVLSKTFNTLGRSLATNRFPFFCGYLVALHVAVRTLLASAVLRTGLRNEQRTQHLFRLATLISGALASWLSLPLLNGRPVLKSQANGTHKDGVRATNVTTTSKPQNDPDLAGRTLDLTLLATTRALETLVHQTWRAYRRSYGFHAGFRARFEALLAQSADPAVFIASCAVIMWAWFYEPHRLPHGYNKWITSAAEVDIRLIEILRAARAGDFVYGKESPTTKQIEPMCEDLNFPKEWADPKRTIPVPCELVHQGLAGPSCHAHAAIRFMRAFRFSFLMYFPLQLVLRMRTSPQRNTLIKLRAAVREATRSSAFLGAFISLFYYAVCLSRTVVGPRLFSRQTISAQQWDSGLCVAAGCSACGWSVLIEPAKRRLELAGFVAPRAFATVLPRRYDGKYFGRERAAFALSVGVLLAAVHDGPAGVRGMLGELLYGVVN